MVGNVHCLHWTLLTMGRACPTAARHRSLSPPASVNNSLLPGSESCHPHRASYSIPIMYIIRPPVLMFVQL